MKTLTLFNAFALASEGLHEVCTIIAGSDMPNDELARFVRMGNRLERQRKAFEAAVRHRLTPVYTRYPISDVLIGAQYATVIRAFSIAAISGALFK